MASKVTHSRAASRLLALGTLLAALMAAFVMLAASQAHASTTFYVNSTADNADANLFAPSCDTGNLVPGSTDSMEAECTLRAAIQQANHTTGADTINFVIPGSGVHTIAPAIGLPEITGPVSINGYSQPGSHPNTKAVGADAVLKIELSGASSVEPAMGLRLNTANSAVKGLAINRWSYVGIFIDAVATGSRICLECGVGSDNGARRPSPAPPHTRDYQRGRLRRRGSYSESWFPKAPATRAALPRRADRRRYQAVRMAMLCSLPLRRA